MGKKLCTLLMMYPWFFSHELRCLLIDVTHSIHGGLRRHSKESLLNFPDIKSDNRFRYVFVSGLYKRFSPVVSADIEREMIYERMLQLLRDLGRLGCMPELDRLFEEVEIPDEYLSDEVISLQGNLFNLQHEFRGVYSNLADKIFDARSYSSLKVVDCYTTRS